MNALFFGSLVLYFAAAVLQLIGTLCKKDKVAKLAWIVFLAGFLAQSLYLIVRGWWPIACRSPTSLSLPRPLPGASPLCW